ncbi:MAG: aspartate aminotransferase family protein [Gemmataceae bacterium]
MDDVRLEQLRQRLTQPLPHPDWEELRAAGNQVVDWIMTHHATLREQRLGRYATRDEMETLLREPAPSTGRPFADVLRDVQEKIAAYSMRVNHPMFLAFVPGAPTPLSILGDWLTAGLNFFSAVWLEGCGPAQVELIVLDWFRDVIGLPESTRGLLTSGGSEANLTALLAARERLTFEERSRAVLYVSELRHLSVDRGARIMGLRPDQIRAVAADDRFRLSATVLREEVERDRANGLLPWAVVANAGATNTGTVDPLVALADVCTEEKLWLHVDAAYGWAACLAPQRAGEIVGLDRADSITLDPHKWFGQTFEAGCVLVRDGQRLVDTFHLRPDYMQDVEPEHDEVNFADYSLALTRRFRALKIWVSVQVLGLDWFRQLAEHSCALAELGQELLERAGFEILCPRQLSIVCFRYRPAGIDDEDALDRLNLELVEAIWQTGKAFLSSTRLRGRVALRFCFINWRSTADDVTAIIDLMKELGASLVARE